MVVLLSNLTEFGVVRCVAKNHKTTELSYFARDFETRAKAQEFINHGFVPAGWRGTVSVIRRGEKMVKATTVGTQLSLF